MLTNKKINVKIAILLIQRKVHLCSVLGFLVEIVNQDSLRIWPSVSKLTMIMHWLCTENQFQHHIHTNTKQMDNILRLHAALEQGTKVR